jgi:hypothetical protein
MTAEMSIGRAPARRDVLARRIRLLVAATISCPSAWPQSAPSPTTPSLLRPPQTPGPQPIELWCPVAISTVAVRWQPCRKASPSASRCPNETR